MILKRTLQATITSGDALAMECNLVLKQLVSGYRSACDGPVPHARHHLTLPPNEPQLSDEDLMAVHASTGEAMQ